MNGTSSCLLGCMPAQVVNIKFAINNIDDIAIYDNCDCKYPQSDYNYSYSVDGVCWTSYMNRDDAFKATMNFGQDFYLKIKISNNVGYITYKDEKNYDYTTALFQSFDFKINPSGQNTFNPYANLDCAIRLQTQLAETVGNMFGIPIYYFKLNPDVGSRDITFKEYALMNVEAVKQIKLIVKDGVMPSSRPEFADFGLEWQTDWETEISKGMFATAFGNTAQPMEGDLIYIPMMKRMWMVNEAYEEKNENMMWNATTFTLSLVKYQEKASVDLGETEELVNSFVKNKYEDLFKEDEENTDSGEEFTDAPRYAESSLYPIFESDAIRKYVSCKDLNISENLLYYKGTLIADSKYDYLQNVIESTIVYQKMYCGSEGSCSFIFHPLMGDTHNSIIEIGNNLFIKLKQSLKNSILYLNKFPDKTIELENDKTYFIVMRWSEALNTFDFTAYQYKFNEKVPMYKLNPVHYWFDIDNPVKQITHTFDIELNTPIKSEILMHSFAGWITNIKIFDVYNDDVNELLQMYPNHQHLLINDTARKLVDGPGVILH